MKKQNKRILSLLMALCLTLALIPAAFAEDTAATITAFNASGAQVGTTYTTIDAAVNAAGEGGKVTISAGVLAVNGRQSITKANVTVEGAGRDQTFIKPSASFASASQTNRKALLTIAANNVTVKGMSIDGTAYGETINMSDSTQRDFVILRINEGSGIILNDVYLTGSPKTLMQLGTGSLFSGKSANVTATEFYCDGMAKTIADGKAYADIDLVNRSTLTVNSGLVNGFIARTALASYTFGADCEPLYTLCHRNPLVYVTATFQHFANSYVELGDSLDEVSLADYATDFTITQNRTTVKNMVDHAAEVASSYQDAVRNFITLLNDAKEQLTSDADKATIQNYIDQLNTALGTQGGTR